MTQLDPATLDLPLLRGLRRIAEGRGTLQVRCPERTGQTGAWIDGLSVLGPRETDLVER